MGLKAITSVLGKQLIDKVIENIVKYVIYILKPCQI